MGLNRLNEAGALLENVSDIDDDYIKLIVEREKINITKMVN